MRQLNVSLDDVQLALSLKIPVLFHTKVQYLRLLKQRERDRTVCILPLAQLELFHLELEDRVKGRSSRRAA